MKQFSTKEALIDFIKDQEDFEAAICCIMKVEKDDIKAQVFFLGTGYDITYGMEAIDESFVKCMNEPKRRTN